MTELALPPAVDFGYVTGQFMPVIWDTPDPDRLPGGGAAVGQVTFTPLQRVVRTPAPNPMTVLLNTVICSFDTNGRLIDSQKAIGVWLVVGQWRVSYDITGHQLTSHDIEVTNMFNEANPLDLTVAAPPSGPSITPSQYNELKTAIEELEFVASGDIAGHTLTVLYDQGWPTRPTSRTDVTVWWIGGPATRPTAAMIGDVHTPDQEN